MVPKHSPEGRFVPPDILETVESMLKVLLAMGEAAKHQAITSPSPTGYYPVAVLFDGNGQMVARADGPVITTLPLRVASVTDGAVVFAHPEQRLSSDDVAKLASVSLSTVKRAVAAGALPKPFNPSERRVVHRLSDVVDWLSKTQPNGRHGEKKIQQR